MTTNITEETYALFSNLLSSDQMLADEAFDSILFSEDSLMNYCIIDVMKSFKDSDGMLCECIQLLSFRCSQNNVERFYTRPQTVAEQEEVVSGLMEFLNSTKASIRLEVLIAVEEIFQYVEKSSKLIGALNTHDLPVIFADEDLCREVQERVEVCVHDPNALVAQRAQECFERISQNIANAHSDLQATSQSKSRKASGK